MTNFIQACQDVGNDVSELGIAVLLLATIALCLLGHGQYYLAVMTTIFFVPVAIVALIVYCLTLKRKAFV